MDNSVLCICQDANFGRQSLSKHKNNYAFAQFLVLVLSPVPVRRWLLVLQLIFKANTEAIVSSAMERAPWTLFFESLWCGEAVTYCLGWMLKSGSVP